MQIIEPNAEGMFKFVLSDSQKAVAKGRKVIINKMYMFDENGELVVRASDAAKMKRILCRYFGCSLVALGDESANQDKSDAKTVSLPAKTEGGPKQPAAEKK